MIKRILNIVLAITLLISVIGVSTTKVYCAGMKELMEKKCCDNADDTKDCCKEIPVIHKLTSDISNVDISISLPDITLFIVAFVTLFENFVAVQEKLHSFSTYSPPRISQDISILIQVFRI